MKQPSTAVYLTAFAVLIQLSILCEARSVAAASSASFVPIHHPKLLSRSINKNTPISISTNGKFSPKSHTIKNKALFIRGGALHSSPSSLVTTLIPKIGILTSTLLYFSPYTSVKHAQSVMSIGSLNPIPLSIMAVSSLSWLVYGLSIRDPYVTLSNVPGCIISIWYVITILPLLSIDSSSSSMSLLQQTQRRIILLSGITIHLWTFLSLSQKSINDISKYLGMYASLLFIVLSGSPLSTIKTVVQTKSSLSILTPLTCAQVVNTALWSVYGLAIRDAFVYGPNVVGLGFGLIQLFLKLVFPG